MDIMRILLEVSSDLAFRASQKAAGKNKIKQAVNIQRMDNKKFLRNLDAKLLQGNSERTMKMRADMKDIIQNMRNKMDEHGKEAINNLGKKIEKGKKIQRLGGALIGGGILAAGAGGALLYKRMKNKKVQGK